MNETRVVVHTLWQKAWCGKSVGNSATFPYLCFVFLFFLEDRTRKQRRKKNNKMALSEEQEVVGRAAC